jgi:hypothetical protein
MVPSGTAAASSAPAWPWRSATRSWSSASTYSYSNLAPWGSHPLTDPLLSTLGTRVIHDDAAFSRIEKTEFIARREMALRTLRVCWNARSGS